MSLAHRVRVDFNRRTGDGSVIASSRRAAHPLAVGDVIIATQSGEDIEHFARVTSVDSTSGRVLLDVNWGSAPSRWAPVAVATTTTPVAPLLLPSAPGLLYRTEVTSESPFASGRAGITFIT